ncbi:lytic transglycosylase domain-containing protein [Polaromonas sp.]|uniref:lytic transglycosylase domain-containing protein n=1 Tax=Polaromonas sp. TaxID=1869339 RepID=UPI00352A6550
MRAAFVLCLGLCAQSGLVQAQALSPRALACVNGAAQYHTVNPQVLAAILVHESFGKPGTVARNSNGSVDVGLAGTNSVHFPELARTGVMPADLLDECVSAYVGAWNLSKKIFKYGNTWQAIGAYHSETPQHNARYQVLIYNKMVDMGYIADQKLTQLRPR